MKYLLFVAVIVSAVFSQQHTYVPLTGKDKRLFEKSAQAIDVATKEHNTEAILRFAPSILSEFQNILLDPDCHDLRASYKSIQDIYTATKFWVSLDSIQNSIQQNYDNQNYLACITIYQTFFPRVVSLKIDSLISFHKTLLEKSCKKYYDSKPTYETLRLIQQLSIVNGSFLDSLKQDLEKRDQTILIKLSTERNIDSLLVFKKNYPGLYENEVNNLIINYRSKWRLAIKRNPTVDGIESYLSVYAEKDHIIDSLYEEALYQDFKIKKTRNSGMKYFSNFPDGKFTVAVQNSMRAWDSYLMRDTSNAKDTTPSNPLLFAR